MCLGILIHGTLLCDVIGGSGCVAEVEKKKQERILLFCMNFNSVRDLVMFMSVYVSHVMSVSKQQSSNRPRKYGKLTNYTVIFHVRGT